MTLHLQICIYKIINILLPKLFRYSISIIHLLSLNEKEMNIHIVTPKLGKSMQIREAIPL